MSLPTRHQIRKKRNSGQQLTPLEELIFWYEPSGSTASEAFRKLLVATFDHSERLLNIAMDGVQGIQECDKCDLCEDHHG